MLYSLSLTLEFIRFDCIFWMYSFIQRALKYLREICISASTVNYPSINVRLDCNFINSFELFFFLFNPTFPTSLLEKCSDKTKFEKPHHCLKIFFFSFFTNSTTMFFRCWPHNTNSHSEQTWCLYGASIDF